MGIGILFQAVVTRNGNKSEDKQFLALRCACKVRTGPIVEEAAICKPMSNV